MPADLLLHLRGVAEVGEQHQLEGSHQQEGVAAGEARQISHIGQRRNEQAVEIGAAQGLSQRRQALGAPIEPSTQRRRIHARREASARTRPRKPYS